MNKDFLILHFDNEPFVGKLITENKNGKLLYKFNHIPYIDGNDEEYVKKEFPDTNIDTKEFFLNTFIVKDEKDIVFNEPC